MSLPEDRPQPSADDHFDPDKTDAATNDWPVNRTPEAKRALAEAEARRRAAQDQDRSEQATEVGGRDGPDPVRYGDWEKNGIAWDF